MGLFNFKSSHVKVEAKEWDAIKEEFNQLVQENKNLREQVKACTSERVQELEDIIAKQSASLEEMVKWKNNDDLIFHHEETAKQRKKEIKNLKAEVQELQKHNDDLEWELKKKQAMSSLLIEKLSKYQDYQTVTRADLLNIRV